MKTAFPVFCSGIFQGTVLGSDPCAMKREFEGELRWDPEVASVKEELLKGG
jgi:hypothetical protein